MAPFLLEDPLSSAGTDERSSMQLLYSARAKCHKLSSAGTIQQPTLAQPALQYGMQPVTHVTTEPKSKQEDPLSKFKLD